MRPFLTKNVKDLQNEVASLKCTATTPKFLLGVSWVAIIAMSVVLLTNTVA